MADPVTFSICIPAYKNTAYLERLLVSISEQEFRDFEVVITDDSPDNSVADFLSANSFDFPVLYSRNIPALGTPENWNEGIRRASGKWIKIMHDDDWFTRPDALSIFHAETLKYPDIKFFFAAFRNVHEETGKVEEVRCSAFDLFFLGLTPLHLFRKVYVGNPSCTIVSRDCGLYYDNRYKFIVDFEYYIRLIRAVGKYRYVDDILINVGFHALQVTKYTFGVPEVQIPENMSVAWKLGPGILRNIFVYDYYWRMFRNLRIRSLSDFGKYYAGETPVILRRMVTQQSRIPQSWLFFGPFSKTCMLFSYLGSLLIKPVKT